MNSETLLLCTDLDRTLIDNGPQEVSPGAWLAFRRLIAQPACQLVYVSGRSLEKVEAAMQQFRLPQPAAIISDVGADIWQPLQHGWASDPRWQERLAMLWPLQHADTLAARLAALPWLEKQPEDCQTRFKLSYFVSASAPPDWPTQVEAHLTPAAAARLIISADETHGLLDILPTAASKYHAIRHLLDARGLSVNHCVFCGDSGNDLEALGSDIPGVLVNNADPEIKVRAREAAASGGHPERLYIASGTLAGFNGHYVGGMLEGIAYFFPHTLQWMGLDRP